MLKTGPINKFIFSPRTFTRTQREKKICNNHLNNVCVQYHNDVRKEHQLL